MEMVWKYDSLNFYGWDMSVSHDFWKVPSKFQLNNCSPLYPPVIFSRYANKSTQQIRLSFAGFHFQKYVRI